MTVSPPQMNPALRDYLLDHSLREAPVLAELRAASAEATRDISFWGIAPEQGQFMAFLVEALGARSILELGTFTGYSSLAMAMAMPSDGRLVTVDVSEEFTGIARTHWEKAGVADRIELRLAPALEALATLEAEGRHDSFDLAFIDAVKEEYADYYEHCLRLVRPGGLILVDNVLRWGRVADPTVNDTKTRLMRAFNDKLHRDERISLTMVPIGDGLTMARRR